MPTKMRGCAIFLEPQLSPDVQRNIFEQHWQLIFLETEVALGCQAVFRYKQSDELASNNTAPDVNGRTTLKMCFPWMCGDYRVIIRVNSALSVIRSVLNVVSSLNRIIVLSCLFPKSQWQMHIQINVTD